MKDGFKLLPDEELHTLIQDQLYILQKKEHFRFGIDAVLLANWAKVKSGDEVIDLGTGSGIIPLLIAYKKRPKRIVGIEIQEEMANLAERSVDLNNFAGEIEIFCQDLRNIREIFLPNTFSLVVSNPPYFSVNRGEQSLNDARAVARHEISCNFTDLAEAAAYLLGTGGRFIMIHKPERIPEIFGQLFRVRLEPKVMCLIQPRIDKSPNLVLLEAVMDGKPGLKVQPNLVIYDESGNYTPKVLQMYNGVGGR